MLDRNIIHASRSVNQSCRIEAPVQSDYGVPVCVPEHVDQCACTRLCTPGAEAGRDMQKMDLIWDAHVAVKFSCGTRLRDYSAAVPTGGAHGVDAAVARPPLLT